MTNCSQESIEFPPLQGRKIEAEFSGGAVTSNGGVQLLRLIDQRLGLLEQVNDVIPDPRDARYIQHSQLSLLRQRVYGLCLGYEDLNDHDHIRSDVAIQSSVDRQEELGSSATLCRLENRVDGQVSRAIHEVLLSQFMDSFTTRPDELILDFDATDDRVHGDQAQRHFHGYYGAYCFLPLYVFCGDQLLVSYLRPSNIDSSKHSWAILSLLVKRLREVWPEVRIVLRGDSHFCRWRMLSWCDRHDVGYIVGIAKNARLNREIEELLQQAEQQVLVCQDKVRKFTEFQYKADSWDKERRVIAKIEVTHRGRNPRYVCTNLNGDAQVLYEDMYCARGEMENQIKQQQLDLFADRTSCHDWWPNQFRVLLSSLAYVLLESLRRLGAAETDLSHAYVGTIRLKLLKIGAVIITNTRRIRFLLSSYYPNQELFRTVATRLAPG